MSNVGLQAVLIVSLAAWLGCCIPAFADGPEAVSGNNSVKKTEELRQKYIEKLKAALEKQNERLQLLEKKIDSLTSKLASSDRSNWRGPVVSGRGNSAPTNQAPPLSLTASTNSQTAVNVQATAGESLGAASKSPATPTNSAAAPANVQTAAGENSNAAAQPNASAPTTPAALADQEDVDALRDLTVIRDQAVTTPPGSIDVTGNVKYVRESTELQFSRALIGTATAYYGIMQGLQVSASVPYYWAYRSTATSPTSFYDTSITSVGDISAQLTGTLFKESLNTPGIFAYGVIAFPTGPNPYWITPGQTVPAQPINPLFFTQSSGQWNGTVGFTVSKSLEPIIVFGGVSYSHYLPRDFAGSVLEPGDRYIYNMGFGLAVSERTMLGALVQGVVQRDLVMNGTPVVGLGAGATSAEAILLTLSLSQRIALGFYFEPAVTIGLTSDAPAAQIVVQLRKSLDPSAVWTSAMSMWK